MRYHYLRLSLLEQPPPALLQLANAVPPARSRQEYLSDIFSSRIDFEHRNRQFVFVPIGEEIGLFGRLLVGRIGRSILARENRSPESGFEEVTRPSWRAANIVIDINTHSDGQKIAFQRHPDVGGPPAIAATLINHLNQANPDSGWVIEVSCIKEERSFWDAVGKFEGRITQAQFTFTTPNVLSIRSNLAEELKDKNERNNAITVTEILRNPRGNLDLGGEDVRDAAEYISGGAGKSKLKVGRDTVYDSESRGTSVEIEDDEPMTIENRPAWKRIVRKLFR